MFCPNCGSPVSDGSRFCANCGAALPAPYSRPASFQAAPPQPDQTPAPVEAPQTIQPQPYRQQDYQQDYQQAYQQVYPQQDQQQAWQQSAGVPVTVKKRSAAKGILIGAGCLLLAALIVGGIWFLSHSRRQNKVLRAAANTLAELKDYTKSLPNLNRIVKNAEALSDSNTVHVEETLKTKEELNYGNGAAYSYGYTIRASGSVDKKAGAVLLDGSVVSDEVNFPFNLYMDEEQFQIASEAILAEDEVLSLPLKDLPKQWNASALAEITGLTLPEDLDLTKFTEFDLEKAMKDAYGEDWTTLCKSLDTVPYEGESPFGGSGTTYVLTWDKEALQRIYKKSGGLEVLEDLDLDDLDGLDLSQLVAKLAGAFLGEFAETAEAPLFYVEGDLLLGVYLAERKDAQNPMEITAWLMGENNPWEHLSVLIHEDFGSYTTDDHMDVAMKKENGQFRIEFSLRHDDSDGKEYCYEEGPYAVIYNDADGKITIEDEEGRQPEDMPEFYLLPEEGGCRFSLKQASRNEYSNSSLELSFAVTNRIDRIAPLSAHPTELLKLSEEELEDLAERIEEKLSQIE